MIRWIRDNFEIRKWNESEMVNGDEFKDDSELVLFLFDYLEGSLRPKHE